MKIQKKKIWRVLFSLLTVFGLAVGCNKSSDTTMGDWSRMSDFDGLPRCDAVAFSIGNMGYVGTGYNGDDDKRLSDFWEYNTDKDIWTQKADMPGSARNAAVGFAIGTMGYVGTGWDGDINFKDFYQFNPTTNTWTKKADFAGTARHGAVGFGIDTKGYLGCGDDDNYMKDFYQYDPASDTWTKINSIGGQKRRDATAFVVNGKGYVVSGIDNGTYLTDLYRFDPTTQEWTKMRNINDSSDDSYDDAYTGISRINGVALVVNGKVYLTLGSSSSLLNTTWQYNPTTDLWDEYTAFEGTTRTEAVGFGIGNYGYITTGRSNSYYLDDIWKFDPSVEYDSAY